MEKVLSLFLSKDRIYFTKLVKDGQDWLLEKINSTDSPLLFDDSANLITKDFQELNSIFKLVGNDFDSINIIYPSYYSIISQIPYSAEVTPEELAKMLELETIRTYPNSSPEDFLYHFYMISAKSIMTIITPNIIKEQANGLLSMYNKPINHCFNENITTLNLFCNNYPEMQNGLTLLVGLENNLMSLNLVWKNQLMHSNSSHYSSSYGITPVLTRSVNKIFENENFEFKGNAYFYGSDLTKDVLNEIQGEFTPKHIQCMRLNPFRSIVSGLTERELEYASRTMQNFSGCIGMALPEVFIQK